MAESGTGGSRASNGAESALDASGLDDLAHERSPFQGLGFYTEADAKWFFGRMTERKIILSHVRTARLTLLYAESGVGKSSLLRAGVAARLRELARRPSDASHSPRFVPIVFSSWKDEPVEDLIGEIERLGNGANGSGRSSNPAPAGPRSGLAETIATAASALDATLVVILDQFEEHFSYRLADRRPDRLADELAECINSAAVPANFLIAVREDTYGRLGDLFSGRIGNVYNNYLHLEYMTREAAREAIERPVQIYNAEHDVHDAISLDHELADAVLDEVRRGKLELGARRPDRDGGSRAVTGADEIETPFLQLVMTRLWECERAQGSSVLRTSTLDKELGGAEVIVRNHVSRALAGLAGLELEAATDIFGDLVTPSGVKVAHTVDDLARMTAHPQATVAAVVARLYEERILRAVDPAPGTSEPRYEIYHDRLASPILDWRDEQQSARLEQAKHRAELDAETQRAQARRFKRRAKIMLVLATGLVVLLGAVGALWLYARHQSAQARKETADATYVGLTARAESQLASRPDLSVLLDLAAYRVRQRQIAERSLVATLASLKDSGAMGILHGHTDAVESVSFSPSGATLASAGADMTLRLWRVTPQRHYALGPPLRPGGPVYNVAFAPNGQTLASGSYNEVILWNVPRRTEQETIPFHHGAVSSVAFTQTGNLLAAGGSDGTVLLWSTATHRDRLLRVPGGGPVRSVAFSPDGKKLAASTDTGIDVWDVDSGRVVGHPAYNGYAYSVAFSPDGRTIAAAGSDTTIRLYSGTDYRQVGSPMAVKDGRPVNSIAFSRDGREIAAGSAGTTVLWSVRTHRQLGPGLASEGSVLSVAFSHDGRILASANADNTITLWRYPIRGRFGVPIVQHPAAVTSVAFSPSGRLLASGDYLGLVYITTPSGTRKRVLSPPRAPDAVSDIAFDRSGRLLAVSYFGGTIELWNVSSGRLIGSPLKATARGSVYSIAFNPSGTRLVSGATDGTVRLWDIRTHNEIGRRLTGDFGAIYAVAFSPNGDVIAAGGSEGVIRLWNATTLNPLRPAHIGLSNAIFSLAFSPNGHLLASGGADNAIHVWGLATRPYVAIHTLTGDTDYIRSLAFSPDGKTLASGSTDNSVRFWDVATGTELGSPLLGDTGSIESLSFTPDGRILASGSIDHTVRLWLGIKSPSSFAELSHEVCTFLGGGLSRAEWAQYAPNIRYHQSCS